MTIEVDLDMSVLLEMRENAGLNAEQIVRKIAFEVEGETKKNAPVDTSALMNSVYTVTENENGYSVASAAVQNSNPDARTEPHPSPAKGEAVVGPCVEYAEYVEYPGTVRRKGVRPYFTPAVEKVFSKYKDGMAWREVAE
jgi:hypothetical protein